MSSRADELETIWRVPDGLWERMSKVLAVYDPPARVGRPRIDQRLAMDALIYRIRTGCQWNYLPAEFGWGMSVYRTFRRWEQKGIFDILWALLLIECEELGGVDWKWQAADGCLGKARGVPRVEKGARATPASASAGTPQTVGKRASRSLCLSRGTAARLRSA
jgi:transposase